ncbi:MAG: ceramidase domain-containing protein [Actinobacteria bacterium]|nr:ceramidase domain-containing protein [Actinomycetota bacterium]MCB9412518.1 ceramidase domain-containing protein [Actinomycetota bacterium]
MPSTDTARNTRRRRRRRPDEPSPWQPLAVAIVLLTIFGVLLAAGGVAGWWDPAANEPAIGNLSRWCERVSGGVIREPVNTAGNLAFVVAGLAMMAVLARDTGRDRPRRNPFIGNQPIALLYAAAAIFLGPGSMLMHASHTFFGAWFDNLSMVAYIMVPVLYNFALLGRWRARWFAAAYLGTVALYGLGYWVLGPDLGINFELFTVAIPLWLISESLVRFPSPQFRWYSGLVGFGIALLFGVFPWTIVLNLDEYWWVILFWLPALITRGPVPVRRTYTPWFWLGLASFLAAFYIWNLGQPGTFFCQPDSLIQGHAIWHALSALATWCFFMFLRTQRFDPGLAEQPSAVEEPVEPVGSPADE